MFLSFYPVDIKTFQFLNPIAAFTWFCWGTFFYVQNFNESCMRPNPCKSNSKVSWKLKVHILTPGILGHYDDIHPTTKPWASFLHCIVGNHHSLCKHIFTISISMGVTAVQRIYVVTLWLIVRARAVVWIQFIELRVCPSFSALVFHPLTIRGRAVVWIQFIEPIVCPSFDHYDFFL